MKDVLIAMIATAIICILFNFHLESRKVKSDKKYEQFSVQSTLFNRYTDSVISSYNEMLLQAIKGNMDSSLYYRGKLDGFNIVANNAYDSLIKVKIP